MIKFSNKLHLKTGFNGQLRYIPLKLLSNLFMLRPITLSRGMEPEVPLKISIGIVDKNDILLCYLKIWSHVMFTRHKISFRSIASNCYSHTKIESNAYELLADEQIKIVFTHYYPVNNSESATFCSGHYHSYSFCPEVSL